jgi:DNA-directed RNA polymerase specialized sigma24 family protein
MLDRLINEEEFNHRLSQVSTRWTLLVEAHGGESDLEEKARNAIIERYQAAIYRYLLGALRDADAADEVFQEFALRLLGGAFRHANAERGRFRNYVKTSLNHLIRAYRARRGRDALPSLESPDQVPAPEDSSADDAAFLDGWRRGILDRAWQELAASQQPGGVPYHEALRLRTEKPDLTTAALVRELNERLKPERPLTESALRKILQRARERFTDLLLDEVARSLPGAQPGELEEELIDLGLHRYCKRALERRQAAERAIRP